MTGTDAGGHGEQAGEDSRRPLRVLLLEDTPWDAEIVLEELRQAGFDPVWRQVVTEAEFRAALADDADVVIADYALPDFDGLAALRLLRERDEETPFILVSGTIAEDVAVRAIREGASDYLLKDRLTRLGSAVERALETRRDREHARRMAEQLRESNERFRRLADHAPDLIFRYTLVPRQAFGYINPVAEPITGYPPAEFYADAGLCWRLVHPDDLPGLRAAMLDGRLYAEPWRFRLRHRDGGQRWIEQRTVAVRDADGRLTAIEGIARDVTDRFRAEEALRRQTGLYEAMLRAQSDLREGMLVLEGERIVFANEAVAQISGYDQAELATLASVVELIPPEERESIRERMQRHRLGQTPGEHYEHGLLHRAGHRLDVEVAAKFIPDTDPPQLLAIVRDVGHRKRLEEQLRQSQKMEAVGRLAGGIAHDFNNLLSVIIGYSELMLHRNTLDEPSRRAVDEVYKAAERASTLTKQLLAFSRKQVLKPQRLRLNDVVANLEKMLRRLIGEDVTLSARYAPDLWPVFADSGQIERVLMNLVVNARDAMPRGGDLVLATANAEFAAPVSLSTGRLDAGRYVRLDVRDSGTGIDPSVLPHIFDPFFTTKAVDQGTGLGLSTVWGIVEQSGGAIDVRSAVGHGTTFSVYLPRSAEAVDAAPAEGAAGAVAADGETLLLVEDEDALRELTRTTLEDAGYRVLTAARGDDALRIIRDAAATIDLLVTDVILPGPNGRELADALRRARPAARVLFMTGYSEDAVVGHALRTDDGTPAEFLHKPYTPSVLLRAVGLALGRG